MSGVVKSAQQKKRLAMIATHCQPITNACIGRGDNSHLSLPTYTPSSNEERTMVKIPLNNYKYATIDDVDTPLINHYQWHAVCRRGAWYVQTTIRDHEDKPRTLYLARLIMNAHDGQQVDHEDHNPLNNTRGNLRLCTPTQNQHNTRSRRGAKSAFKGVYSIPQGRWAAQICRNGKKEYLGKYASEEEAAHAYDAAAKMYYGQFACLNFPEV